MNAAKPRRFGRKPAKFDKNQSSVYLHFTAYYFFRIGSVHIYHLETRRFNDGKLSYPRLTSIIFTEHHIYTFDAVFFVKMIDVSGG